MLYARMDLDRRKFLENLFHRYFTRYLRECINENNQEIDPSIRSISQIAMFLGRRDKYLKICKKKSYFLLKFFPPLNVYSNMRHTLSILRQRKKRKPTGKVIKGRYEVYRFARTFVMETSRSFVDACYRIKWLFYR